MHMLCWESQLTDPEHGMWVDEHAHDNMMFDIHVNADVVDANEFEKETKSGQSEEWSNRLARKLGRCIAIETRDRENPLDRQGQEGNWEEEEEEEEKHSPHQGGKGKHKVRVEIKEKEKKTAKEK